MTDIQTSDREVSRAIRSWLHEDRHEDASRLAGTVLDQVEATPQRRSTWWPPRRTPIMSRSVTIGLGAAAVAVAAVFVGAQLFGAPSGGMGSQATPTPEQRPHVLYEATAGGVPITVTIAAADWQGEPGVGILERGSEGADPPDGAGMIAFYGREYYVYGDPCQWSSTRPDTPATTVEELVDALANQASRDASAPEDITLDGYAGKKIILQVAGDVDIDACDEGKFALFGLPGDDLARHSQGPEQIEEVWALDVDGLIVVLDGVYYAETPSYAVAELRDILASATFAEPEGSATRILALGAQVADPIELRAP